MSRVHDAYERHSWHGAPDTASAASRATAAPPEGGVGPCRDRGVAALVTMALATTAPDQVLDPDDAGPTGGKAIVEVLRDHGVDVEVVRSVEALADAEPGPGTTVVMANSAYVGHGSAVGMGTASAGADRLVLLSPSAAQLAVLDLPLTSGQLDATVPMTAQCSSTVARADDTAALVDVRLIPVERGSGPAATLCFALPDPSGDNEAASGSDAFGFGAAMATVPAAADHPEVVALGISSTSRTAGSTTSRTPAWRFAPSATRPDCSGTSRESATWPTSTARRRSPWPVWLAPGAAVIATAVLVLAFVRGRRMGALVTEPLPVVVRAVETTESRGRIYRRARDRGRAAAILRLGSTDRLARRLALPPQAAEAVQAAAAAASGMPPAQVAALLAGPPPTTDVELHTLATALTDLEERVRRS